MQVIKEGAIFIADSHYPHHGDNFLVLLHKLESGEIQASQIFLMGDNFDLLFGYNKYIQTFSKDAIQILQKLSTKMEIYYFEGNHDFLLSSIFPNIKVFSRDMQPQIFDYRDLKVGLSHGDKYAMSIFYEIYTKIIRNKFFITALKPFSKILINDRMHKLSKKDICIKFKNFESRIKNIMSKYQNIDIVIEGHYHQGIETDNYISLPSLACDGKIVVIIDEKFKLISY